MIYLCLPVSWEDDQA